jgi:hypothetical protein
MSIGPISFRSQAPDSPRYRRGWVDEAVAAIEADQCRTADTQGLDPAPYEAELNAFLATAQPPSFAIADAQNPLVPQGAA